MNIDKLKELGLTTQKVDHMFLEAYSEADRSQCLRKKVGSSLLNLFSNSLVGLGHGGAVDKCKECVRDVYEWHQDGCWSIHSEMRAISSCTNEFYCKATDVIDWWNMVMFITHGPCDQCLKIMHYTGIKTVVYDNPYHPELLDKWRSKIDIFSREELNELLRL